MKVYIMDISQIKSVKINRLFWLFACLHVLAWTVGPSLFRESVTHDTLEGIAWGMQWQWGYDKHPPLTAWLVAGITILTGVVGWPVYLLAQLAVLMTFVSVFQMAKYIMHPLCALMSVLLLEGIIYHTINSVNLTPDTMQTPFWALITWSFYLAIKNQRCQDWILVGLWVALAMLTKYAIGLLLIAMAIVAFFTPEGRKSFYHYGLYLSVLIFLLLTAPHIYWAYQQGFSGLSYIHESVNDNGSLTSWVRHFYYPFKYFMSQIGVLLGAAILCWPLRQKQKPQRSDLYFADRFDKYYFTIMGMAPFLGTVLFSIYQGTHTIGRWSTPYFYLTGLLFFMWWQPVLISKKLKQFMITVLVVASLVCISRNTYYWWGPKFLGKTHSDAYLPNRAIATIVSERWEAMFPNDPLSYIAGSHYLAAYITAYADAHPVPYMDWDKQQSPWVDEKTLQHTGAVFVWEVDNEQGKFPQEILDRYPTLIVDKVYRFDKKVPITTQPIYILLGFLPPAG